MDQMMTENDDYLLSRLLDDDLSPDESAAMRHRMSNEPALRARFEAITEVHRLLRQRQADAPTADWDAFHQRVMRAVEAETRPPIIRFPLSLRVGVPFAAASAIVLLFALNPFSHDATDRNPAPHPTHVVTAPTAPPQPIRLARPDHTPLTVTFDRPSGKRRRRSRHIVRVTYTRSEDLAAAVRQRDEAGRRLPSIVSALARPAPTYLEIPDSSPL